MALRLSHAAWRSVTSSSTACDQWVRLYGGLGLDAVVVATQAGPHAAPALLAASRRGAATVVLANSWKDAYRHPDLLVQPTVVGVTTQLEAQHLRRQNSGIAARVAVVGSLHLQRFFRPGAIISRSEFCRRLGLAPNRPFLCYTAAAPDAICREEVIVEILLQATRHHPLQPQVLLRLNPREEGERFRRLVDSYGHLKIQRPQWEWDPRKDWNAPLPADLDEWIATVRHAAYNVSIPSTVTWEFKAMGRPTLNVCFESDPNVPYSRSNRRCWDAPFYQGIRTSPFIYAAFSKQEFTTLASRLLASSTRWRADPPEEGAASPVEAAARLIEDSLRSKGWAAPEGDSRLVQNRNHPNSLAAAGRVIPLN